MTVIIQEEPGENLSDCDKDDEEESLEEGCSKPDDEDESEDGFFVPDGYLSENEVRICGVAFHPYDNPLNDHCVCPPKSGWSANVLIKPL